MLEKNKPPGGLNRGLTVMEGKLSMGLFSPGSISFNENAIVRNFTLESCCRQLEGNLHVITFDYRTTLDL